MDPKLPVPTITVKDQLENNTALITAADLRSKWNQAQNEIQAGPICQQMVDLAGQYVKNTPRSEFLPHLSCALISCGTMSRSMTMGSQYNQLGAQLLQTTLDSVSQQVNGNLGIAGHPDLIRAQILLDLHKDQAISTEDLQRHLHGPLVRLMSAGPQGLDAAKQVTNYLTKSDNQNVASYGTTMGQVVSKTEEFQQAQAYLNEVMKLQGQRQQSTKGIDEQITIQVNDLVLSQKVQEELLKTAQQMEKVAFEIAALDPVSSLPRLREVSAVARTVMPNDQQLKFLEQATQVGIKAQNESFVLEMTARRVGIPGGVVPPVAIECMERSVQQRQQELDKGITSQGTNAARMYQRSLELVESLARSPTPEHVQLALKLATNPDFSKIDKESSAQVVVGIASLQGNTRIQVDPGVIAKAGADLLESDQMDSAMEVVSLLQNQAHDLRDIRYQQQAADLMVKIGKKQMEAVLETSPNNPNQMSLGNDDSEEITPEVKAGNQVSELQSLHEVAQSLEEMKLYPEVSQELRTYGLKQASICCLDHAKNRNWQEAEDLLTTGVEIGKQPLPQLRKELAGLALQVSVGEPNKSLSYQNQMEERLEALEAALILADPTDLETREAVLKNCTLLSQHLSNIDKEHDSLKTLNAGFQSRLDEIKQTAKSPSLSTEQLHQDALKLELNGAKGLAFSAKGRLRMGDEAKVLEFTRNAAMAVEQAYNELATMNLQNWDGAKTHLNNLNTLQARWSEAGQALNGKTGLNENAKAGVYFELVRLDDGADFYPSAKKSKDATEKKYFDGLRKDLAQAYPPDGEVDKDPAKRQAFIDSRVKFHSENKNAKLTTLASDKGLKMLSARAGYLIEERTYQLLADKGLVGWNDQNTKVLGPGTRPDITLPLGGDRHALLDITASNSSGHILKKSPCWTDKPGIPAAIEITYPSFDSKQLPGQLLEKQAQFPGQMAEKRQAHLLQMQQIEKDRASVLNWIRDLRDHQGQPALNNVAGKTDCAHLVKSLGLSTSWKGLNKLPSKVDEKRVEQAMQKLEATYGPNPVSKRNALAQQQKQKQSNVMQFSV